MLRINEDEDIISHQGNYYLVYLIGTDRVSFFGDNFGRMEVWRMAVDEGDSENPLTE